MTHWSEKTSCACGRVFRVASPAEAQHRHNFPALCKNPARAQRIADELQAVAKKEAAA